MVDEDNKTDPSAVMRTSTDVESREGSTTPKPAQPQDNLRTSTDVESRAVELEQDKQKSATPTDTLRGQ
jgi:hypothetical protein